jgi:hypothetical protein
MATEKEELEEAERQGSDLESDDSPERGKSGNLSDETPEGREDRAGVPDTHEVTEDGED